ncbi:MAG: bifunctional serine/threonine-protein kinase/formylglycine-generating enzyme family protein [Planctomycetota bacterium]
MSSAARYARVHQILGRARSLHGERLDAYLAQACGHDTALRDDVLALLAAGRDDETDAFSDDKIAGVRAQLEDMFTDASVTARPPETIGGYRILRQIGRGGMGIVYEAEQQSPRRTVALKVLQPGLVRDDLLKRFAQEALVLGLLQHPNIASIHDAGTCDLGFGTMPFFAMELVAGQTLTDFVRDHDLDVRARIGLVARICEAVQHAHERGVIHRDLKPANILVSEQAGSAGPQPKILDFGIARSTDHDKQLSTLQTRTGQLLGTLSYMSPEQVRDSAAAIDPRSDVYSLGVLLYETLAGELPLDLEGHSITEIGRIIQEVDPVPLGRVNPECRGDLQTVCAKALAKDKQLRYGSAAELADDLQRWLATEPVLARPQTTFYHIAKFARRNKALVGGVAATLLVAIVGAIVATSYAIDAFAANAELQTANTDLETARNEAQDSAEKATAAATREKQRADEVLQLADLQDLDELLARADRLWPTYPMHSDAYREWIADAEKLVAQLPSHRATRDELRARAVPRTAEQRVAERRAHPRWRDLVFLEQKLAAFRAADAVRKGERPFEPYTLPEGTTDILRELVRGAAGATDPQRIRFGYEARGLALARRAVQHASPTEKALAEMMLAFALFANGLDDEALESAAKAMSIATEKELRRMGRGEINLKRMIAAARSGETLATLEQELAMLDALVDTRIAYDFPPQETDTDWWEQQLTLLIEGVEALADPETGLLSAGRSMEHGWGVRWRQATAARLREQRDDGGSARTRWQAARAALDTAYPGLDLPPQTGLVPIGVDPESGLHEFWHILSGAEPQRDAEGRLVLTETSGIVLVLLPGGSFLQGAQPDDPQGPNHDEDAIYNEGPMHQVALSPFFLSKYEVTQSQWERFVGNNPSRYPSDGRLVLGVTPQHPVESVSWQRCVQVLGWMGLMLPTEAQWEYGCRAGTATPFSCATADDLRHHANVADLAYVRYKWHKGRSQPMPWDDRFGTHAPVGSFQPNAFGLHDVHGNVWEWCLDGYYDMGGYPDIEVTDPLRAAADVPQRVRRGGDFSGVAKFQRSAMREGSFPEFTMAGLGVRPARAIER